MTTLLGMLGLGLLEMLVILCAGLLMLMTFGGLFAALGSVFPASRGPCILGVCWRLARHLEAPVRAVRLLIVAAIVLTGILPGVLLYLAAGVIQSWFDGAIDESLPGFAATDTGPMVLGVCRRLARRLDVRVGPVRLLVALVGLVTGVFPGLILYFLAAFLRTDHARRSLGRYSQILDTLRHDLPAASDRSGAFRAASTRPRRIGRYRILGELGVGGMGTVYRGRDDALARDAAVKVIRPLPGDDADARQRFGEEARAAASLASPHIVQIYEFDPVGSPPFLAMELVPGVSVQRMVQRQGAMPAATVVDCAQQVLAGLATAHAAGIIHRDIKPANILLATSGPAAGTYKLTDFGLARSPDRQHTLTASGSLLGTLLYLAPEVAIGDDATAPSDLYSLGATLHEMLAGRPPLTADSPLKLLRRITTETPPPISHARPDLPADLAAWLDRLLAHDPASRFQSAAQALTTLSSLPVAADATTGLSPEDAVAAADDILGRPHAVDSASPDLIGEQTVTDIAHELSLDAHDVRAILRTHRRGRGGRGRNTESIVGMFGEALGRKGGRDGTDRWSSHRTATLSRSMPRRQRRALVAAYAGAMFAVGFALIGWKRPRDVATLVPPRPVVVMPTKTAPPLPLSAEADPDSASLHNAVPGHSLPFTQPPKPAAGTVSPPSLAPSPRQVFRHQVGVPTGIGVVLISSFALGFALVCRALRRRRARNWP
ncbi:MAG: hypothetical protein DWH79_07670 [Planctomycetota bacterium]|nr:MAG: hypothetical protein DWH79_07670 [Planctomycetota bacterium]